MAILPANRIMTEQAIDQNRLRDQIYAIGCAYVDGHFVPAEEARIPLYDMGFLQGDATYEKMTVANGRYFRAEDHFRRMQSSCEKFRLCNPYSEEEMLRIFDELLRRTGLPSAGVWWGVTRGLQKDASDRGNPGAFENRFYAAAGPYVSIVTDLQRLRGLDIMVGSKYLRIPRNCIDPTAKNTNWMDMKLSLFEARDRGKEFSVLVDERGFLTEAPGANIFVQKEGQLYTPEFGCLEGITRQTVIELATDAGIQVNVGWVHRSDLLSADDAFLTSSAGGVMPINSVDDIVLGGSEGPGPLVQTIHNLYWEKLWSGWKGTPVKYDLQRRTQAD